jgi:stage II sporulation protein AA (anti-sigma F factor antagonist)
MQIQEQRQGAVTVLKPVGPLTEADSEQFRATATELLKRSLGRLVIDASAISFVDSTGLETLVDLTEQLTEGGRALKLCATNETLREVIDLTGWADAFEYYADINSGVRSFL